MRARAKPSRAGTGCGQPTNANQLKIKAKTSVVGLPQECRLQVGDIQRYVLPESPLEGLPLRGCLKAAWSTEVRPPARGALRPVQQRLVLLVENQSPEQRFRLLLSAPQTRSYWRSGLLVHTEAETCVGAGSCAFLKASSSARRLFSSFM